MKEKMAELTQICSELPPGKYLYGYLEPIPLVGGFTTSYVKQFIIVHDWPVRKEAGWVHFFDDGGEAWTNCWMRTLGEEVAMAFKMHDHVNEYTNDLWMRAVDRLTQTVVGDLVTQEQFADERIARRVIDLILSKGPTLKEAERLVAELPEGKYLLATPSAPWDEPACWFCQCLLPGKAKVAGAKWKQLAFNGSGVWSSGYGHLAFKVADDVKEVTEEMCGQAMDKVDKMIEEGHLTILGPKH